MHDQIKCCHEETRRTQGAIPLPQKALLFTACTLPLQLGFQLQRLALDRNACLSPYSHLILSIKYSQNFSISTWASVVHVVTTTSQCGYINAKQRRHATIDIVHEHHMKPIMRKTLDRSSLSVINKLEDSQAVHGNQPFRYSITSHVHDYRYQSLLLSFTLNAAGVTAVALPSSATSNTNRVTSSPP